MLEAVRKLTNKSVYIELNPKVARDLGDGGCLTGTILSADSIGISARVFMSSYMESQYYSRIKNVTSPKETAKTLIEFTDVIQIPWHAIVYISG
jgi:hypothetical protein